MSKKNETTKALQAEGRKLTETLKTTGRELWLASLGMVATVEEESRGLFDRLVERGGKVEKKSDLLPLRSQIDEMTGRVKKAGDELDQRFQKTTNATLERFGVPSSRDVQELIHRVEHLTTQVESLAAQRS